MVFFLKSSHNKIVCKSQCEQREFKCNNLLRNVTMWCDNSFCTAFSVWVYTKKVWLCVYLDKSKFSMHCNSIALFSFVKFFCYLSEILKICSDHQSLERLLGRINSNRLSVSPHLVRPASGNRLVSLHSRPPAYSDNSQRHQHLGHKHQLLDRLPPHNRLLDVSLFCIFHIKRSNK